MLIDRTGNVLENPWHLVETGNEAWPEDHMLFHTGLLTENAERLKSWNGKLGILLDSDGEPEAIKDFLPRVELIALRFPKYADGRPYSTARLLRDRYGFDGDLRAVGDVLPDQLAFMVRCGFSSFDLARARDPSIIETALREMCEAYQISGDAASVQSIWQKRHGLAASQDEKER